MAKVLEYPSDASTQVSRITTTLQLYLKSECGLVATEIVKAGSLGQGTAVPGEFDLDLIVYSEDLTPEYVLRNGLKDILQKIHLLFQYKLKGNYKKVDVTDHALQFSYDGLEVDLLPSPYWPSPASYHSYLKDLRSSNPRGLRMFSCTSAKWLKEFFLSQPNEVREYIRRAKKWRNKMWPVKEDGVGRPKSILIGLLVVEAYDQSHDGKPASVTRIVQHLVKEHKSLKIHWTHKNSLYSENYMSYFPKQPYIIDPANPFNNVYKSGISRYLADYPEISDDGNWTNFVRHINSLDLLL